MADVWQERARSFDANAAQYDAVRPDYPAALVDAVLAEVAASRAPADADAGTPDTPRALEIGAGTGKATRLFAARGVEITAVEPGAALIEVARASLPASASVGFANARFEDWPLEPGRYDLVYAAQSFHWVDPATGYTRAGQALRPGGVLALFWNRPGREQDPIQRQLAALRASRAIELAEELTADQLDSVERGIAANIDATGLFEPPRLEHFPWVQTLSARDFVALLETYSAYAILDAAQREPLLEASADLIERNGGTIDVHYDAVVHTARRHDR